MSTKTDIYALGLILHELFTGKRVFNEASVQELREAHLKRGSTFSTLSSSTFDLDPAIDRVIQRCLERDPKDRPASALAVAAALPGGDPLAAALAAGETPSPELVAGAGSVGALRPAVGWTLLLVFALGVIASAWFAHQVRFYRLAPEMRSPEVLASRVEDLLDTLGSRRLRGDHAYGWMFNSDVTEYVRQRDQQADRWERLAAADGPALQFWYRQSPGPLVPYNDSGNVNAEDPPLVTPGMINVVVTSRGRLLSYRAVPTSEEGQREESAPPNWSPLFAAAGVDPAALRQAEPERLPPIYADARAAWEGPYPHRPDWTMRIEAASYRSRPVYFEVVGPWARAGAAGSDGDDRLVLIRQGVQIGAGLVAIVLGVWLARRNARAGRADTRGAFLIGLSAGAPLVVAWLIGSHHTGDPDAEYGRFITHLGVALYWGVLYWLLYLAIEPYVRRRWPEALISWTRLLAGRFGDPLVGRDILIGLVGGIAISLIGDVTETLPGWLGQPPISPTSGGNARGPLGSTGAFLAALALRPTRVLSESLLILFLLLLAHIVLRNRWLAYAAMAAMFVALAVNREAVVLSTLALVAFVGIVVFLISRFGLLSYIAAMFAMYAINDLPFVLDTSAWFAMRSAVVAAMLGGMAGWGFYTSLGRRQTGRLFVA